MIRLLFFVEGQTEQEYVHRVLVPHLAAFDVYAERPTLPITGRKGGRTFKGGGRSFEKVRHHLDNLLKEHHGPLVRFTTMFDLYKLMADFPRLAEAERLRGDPYERVAFLEKAFGDQFGDARLIPHLQLHEFETLLLCEPEIMAFYFDKVERAATELSAVVQERGNPELVNDGNTTAPSMRIKSHFPEYQRLKTTVGVEWAECVGLVKARKMCRHFDMWLTKLEGLGNPPTNSS